VVEKPLTRSSLEAEELIELAGKKGVVISAYQNRRWDGDFLTIRKVLEQDKIGRLIEFESHYDRYRPVIVRDTWKEESDELGGVLFNLGSHMVDQAFVLFGKPVSVTAHLKMVRSGSSITDYYDLRFEYTEFAAILKCSYLVKEGGPRYSIYGESGTFHKWGIDPQEELLKAGNLPIGSDWAKEPKELWGKLVYENDGLEVKGVIETVQGNYKSFYENIYDVIRNGAELAVKPEETLAVLKILEACIESNRLKKTIFL
jgi:predicted dehydrogenase